MPSAEGLKPGKQPVPSAVNILPKSKSAKSLLQKLQSPVQLMNVAFIQEAKLRFLLPKKQHSSQTFELILQPHPNGLTVRVQPLKKHKIHKYNIIIQFYTILIKRKHHFLCVACESHWIPSVSVSQFQLPNPSDSSDSRGPLSVLGSTALVFLWLSPERDRYERRAPKHRL